MKLIIAGGRDFSDTTLLAETVNEMRLPEDVELVCGMARGADLMAKEMFDEVNQPVKCFPAQWDKHGKAAGFIRNKEMAHYADELLAFWDGQSHGTKNMITTMRKLGKPVTVVRY